MSTTNEKLTRLKHLVELGNRTKAELDALSAQIQEIVTVGGEPNVIEVVKVNGEALTITDKAVNITVPEAYDDTALAGRVAAIEADYLVEADKYDDTALAARVKAVEDDYLVEADKTELAGNISANADAIAAVKEDVDAFFANADLTESAKDTLKEIQEYINSDATAAAEMTASIQQNANDIDAVEGRVGTLEGQAHTHGNKTVLDGITAEKVSAWDAAEGNAKTYADGLNTAMDARVQVVEGKAHEHANKAELDLIASGDKAKWDQAVTDIGTVKADYLTSAAKTALEGSISAVDAKFANYYTSAQIDAMIATDAEVTAALDEVFAAE